MNFSENLIKSYKEAKVFQELSQLNCIDYLYDGTSFGVSTNDTLKIYCPIRGILYNTIHIPQLRKFIFLFKNTILHSTENYIKYLSLYDNQYIRSFKCERVKSLSSNINNDLFLSSSNDCVNVWDLRCKNSIYKLSVNDSIVSFSSNNKFCVNVGDSLVKQYDMRNVTYGPEKTIYFDGHDEITGIQYSNDSKNIIISSNNIHTVVSAETGKVKYNHCFDKVSYACASPDSKYLFCTSGSHVFVYGIDDKKKVHTFKDSNFEHGLIKCNPAYTQFVTASTSVVFWMPPQDV
ncbi:hypothetical protein LUQ84_000711 [Hamiltosporidium tvaerminnensis]|nr:hypothetical protein LUQ84_000711 [Hamiltosporidium tvaerminnensis]